MLNDYFELEPVLPVLEPEPMPVEPLVLPAPDGLLVLGDALEPLEDGELVEPLEDEPLVEPCSRRHFSFSVPVRLAHCADEPVDEPVALGEAPAEPLVEDELLPLALGVLPTPWDDESAAMTAVEAAKSAARVAAESAFNICGSPKGGEFRN